MNPIQSLSTPITVPAFGQGKPVESVNRPEALRVELDPARAEKLTEAILVAQQLEKAGVSLQPQLRGPANGLPDDPRVAEFVSRAANEGVSGAAMLQDSFDRHFSTAAEDVDAADHAKDTPETVQRSLSPAWAALFAAFMDALRESRRANRELSVEQSAASFESTKNAGKSAIEAARSNMLASIVAATVTTTISAGHVAKSAQGAKVLNTSAQQNQIPQQPAAATPPAAPSSATPAAPTAPSTTTAPDAASASTPSTPAVPQAPTAANTASDGLAVTPQQTAAHTMAQAEAGKLHDQGLFLQTIASPMGQIASSGGQLAASADEAARLEYQAAAETDRQISSTQNEQASHDEQLRDAALQVLQRLYSELQQSSSRIIGNI